MSESVLTMNQVEKRYRNVPVLQDITMEIPRGSIYGWWAATVPANRR